MSEEGKSPEEILMLACAILETMSRAAEKRGYDGHEITLATAQALAMAIEINGKPGFKKSIAADMATIVAAYPPIEHDQPMSEAVH
jgi:hypothetical protein